MQLTTAFDDKQPIYLQLLEIFMAKIVSGEWEPGSQMDSVRNIALDFGLNPNTVQKSLAELERLGLASSERTARRVITSDLERIQNLRKEMAVQNTKNYIQQVQALHLSEEDVIALIHTHWSNNETTGEE